MLCNGTKTLTLAVFAILLISVLSLPHASQFTLAANYTPRAVIPPTSGGSNAAANPTASAPGRNAPSTSAKGDSAAGIPVMTTGVIVPLYSDPGSDWDVVIQAKQADPSVPIVAVINPSTGPGGSQNQSYVSGVGKLRSAGITVLGYVPTNYAARSSSSAIAEINLYKTWYAVNGIFFDEMSNVQGNEAYYSSLSAYARSIGLPITFGNPGASVPASYVGAVDCIVVYESQGLPNSSSLAGWTMGMSKNNFATIAYGVDRLDSSSISNLSNQVGYVYVTDSSLPNPYGALPSYFTSFVAALDTLVPTSVALSVQSVNLTGSPISGILTEIRSNDSVVASGFSPIVHVVPSAERYVVSIDNNGTYVFDHWDDGSVKPVRTVTPTQETTLIAYFRDSSAFTVGSVSSDQVPLSSTISGPSVLQISYTNNSNATLTGVVFGVIHSSAGKTIGYATGTISPAAGESATAYLILDGLSPGTYSVTILAMTYSGLPLSAATTFSVSF